MDTCLVSYNFCFTNKHAYAIVMNMGKKRNVSYNLCFNKGK